VWNGDRYHGRRTTVTNQILEELMQDALERRAVGPRLEERHGRLGTDRLVDYARHAPLLEALFVEGPLDRRDLEAVLDVSRATSHRFTRWLDEEGLARRVDGRFELTGKGQVVAEELLRVERNLVAADALAPLLDVVCEDHQELVVDPFVDATLTEATPADPYAPVGRLLALLRDSETFRGFNATHVVPPSLDPDGTLFADVDAELVVTPAVARTLGERDGAGDRFVLRTREALPYGLAIFDDRVAIGGYDDETGTLRVLADTDSALARGWAERVWRLFREDSEPFGPDPGTGTGTGTGTDADADAGTDDAGPSVE
jgi:hypothetical protein